MYKKIGELLVAVLEPLAEYPEDLQQVGLTANEVRTAVKVIRVLISGEVVI